ncbi:EAL domain-containing protein [Cohnella sp. CFH 77786]|uniref:bifunctional diguanylate cyclase/phosphodiesterase n=1 Tax=Cohnella sp. CFH 77786 TaxID=2662265 RepID=UPI001C609E4E|nr:EAL domain-containing protein [Cohnella sp. CFH 77786]MBW5449303.1 EAL domain-containing protein [Cohnella sp. CFH 77786]
METGMNFPQDSRLLHETISRLDIVLWARDYETRRLLYISEGCGRVFGISQEDAFQLSSFVHIVHPHDSMMTAEKIYGGTQQTVEYRIIHPQTGELRWIQTQVRPETDAYGRMKSIHGISIDVTNRKLPVEIMRTQNEVLSLIALGKPLSEILWKIAELTNTQLSGRACSILLVDQERQVFVNGASPGFPDIYQDAMVNRPFRQLNNPSVQAVFSKKPVIVPDVSREAAWEHSAFNQAVMAFGLKSCYVYPILSVDHEVVAVFALYSQTRGEPGEYEPETIESFTHLTSLAIERKENERKIRKLAYYDSLTGLYNRSYFTDKFQQFLDNKHPINGRAALLYIDLDQFKWVNDSLGHDAGDQLLVEAAGRMNGCLSENQILSRIGGDEFAMLVQDIATEAEAFQAAGKIKDCFDQPFSIRGHECRIGLSIGVCLYPDHGLTAGELMKHADTAMYQAKSGGRNKVKLYHPSWNDAVYDRFVLRTQFHNALLEKQFFLHYQPRIELCSGEVHSVEALIRWNHPVRGLISPSEFISLAEESGFIVTLGEWVMREACRQNKAWQDRGYPPLRVAVNVSAQQFRQESFVSKVKEILMETDLHPRFLEIEITESALMDHEERIIQTLHRLNEMGVYVAVDDFGTGYSSLNYLKRFEVNALKIDQTFIRDLQSDRKDESITRMIISLASSLGLDVIGEGVETRHQHDFLLQNGCRHAQGYLYSKPLSAKSMEEQLIRDMQFFSLNPRRGSP